MTDKSPKIEKPTPTPEKAPPKANINPEPAATELNDSDLKDVAGGGQASYA